MKIVILDEPTVGIDQQSRNHILESVKKLALGGTTRLGDVFRVICVIPINTTATGIAK